LRPDVVMRKQLTVASDASTCCISRVVGPPGPPPIASFPQRGNRIIRRDTDGPRRASSSFAIAVAVLLVPCGATRAQQPDSTPRLGLGASSAVSVHAGLGRFKHASLGPEVGGVLDLGWIGSRLVRFSVGIDYLATTIDRADTLGIRARGSAYVFTGFADVNAMAPVARRFSPYGGVGFGVDAVGTTISNEQIGAIYNTNVFDLHAQLGTLIRLTPQGRLRAEARVTGARVVRRYGLRLGYTWLFNTLREGVTVR
jgi:hypothetical protein